MTQKALKTGIEKRNLKKGEDFSSAGIQESVIIFLLEGELNLQINGKEVKIASGKMVFFPAGALYTIRIGEDSSVILFPFDVQSTENEGLVLSELLSSNQQEEHISGDFSPCLPFRKTIRHFLFLMEVYIDNQIDLEDVHQIKIRELVVLLTSFYTQQELAGFFAPVFNNELKFREIVSSNYLKFNTVEALAEYTCYSTSGFIKKFQRVFHESPYRWMLRNKAQRMLSDIKLTEKSFKEISQQYGFSSPSHFYLFCKKYYNESPSVLRSNIRKRSNQERLL